MRTRQIVDSNCPIDEILSIDNLIHVFQWLPIVNRVNCERVCQKWCEVANYVNSVNQSAICLVSQRSPHRHGLGQNFCIDPLHQVSSRDTVFGLEGSKCPVVSVLRRCPNLRSLHFRVLTADTLCFENIHLIGELCPKLEHISFADDVRGLYIHTQCVKLIKNCRKVRHLQLWFPANRAHGSNLDNLIVTRCVGTIRENLDTLVVNVPLTNENCSILAANCPLRKLSVQGNTISASNLSVLLQNGGLVVKSLRLLTMSIENNEQIDIISRKLVSLNSLHCVITCNSSVSLSRLSTLRQLRSLILNSSSKSPIDFELVHMLKGFRKLRSLTVTANLGDYSLKQFSNCCPELERLEVNCKSKTPQLSDLTVQDCLINLSYLSHLGLHNVSFTDSGFKLLLKSTELDYLRITLAPNLSGKSLSSLIGFAIKRQHKAVKVILPKLLNSETFFRKIPNNLFLSFI
ncbi:hypothetical protein HDE_06443 [Halotydeus destructor]|nr:hypothetical protein HDE_06443 [Halotydeus destructor]